MSDFLPPSYQSPKMAGRYLKLKDGDSIRLRILSKPIFYWEWWTQDNKPLRVEYDGSFVKTPEGAKEGSRSRFCWALIVYNYNTDQTEIWNIGQASIREALEGYIRDPDAGDPTFYDIKVSRKGSQMDDTIYSLMPLLKQENMKPMGDIIVEEAKKINLRALLTGANPFESTSEDGKVSISDVPF